MLYNLLLKLPVIPSDAFIKERVITNINGQNCALARVSVKSVTIIVKFREYYNDYCLPHKLTVRQIYLFCQYWSSYAIK